MFGSFSPPPEPANVPVPVGAEQANETLPAKDARPGGKFRGGHAGRGRHHQAMSGSLLCGEGSASSRSIRPAKPTRADRPAPDRFFGTDSIEWFRSLKLVGRV